MIFLLLMPLIAALVIIGCHRSNDEDYLHINDKRWRRTPEGWKKCMLIGEDERSGHIWWFDGKYVWEQSRYTRKWWGKTDPGWIRGFHLQGIMADPEWGEWWKRNKKHLIPNYLRDPKSGEDLESLEPRQNQITESKKDLSRNRPPDHSVEHITF